MMVTETGKLMMLFVQQRLYEGLQPDINGFYIISRKEFLERLELAPSTFSARIKDLTDYYMHEWDLEIMFDLKGLIGENLYTDISYSSGKLKFKRNSYTERPELSYVWARKPRYWDERRLVFETVPVPPDVVLPIQK